MTKNYIKNMINEGIIEFMGQRCISDEHNFMFGQSEVRITSQGILQFNRRGKSCKLYGNHQDGSYRITKMYECKLDR